MRSTPSSALAVIAWTSAAMAGGVPFHDAVDSSDPILWYRLDEAPGSTMVVNHGSLGPSFNGVAFNGVTFGAASIAGDGGAAFNNVLQQSIESLSVAPASMTGNPTFSAEAVVRVNAGNANTSDFGWPPMLHWGAPFTGQSVYFSLWRFSENRYYAGFYNGGLRTSATVPQNCFLHIVWVRDSAGGTAGQYQGTTLYINGVAMALEVDNTLPGAPVIAVTPTTFRLQKATDGTRYFAGIIDEIALYDRPLSPAEVLAHFASLTLGALTCPADLTGDGQVGGADLGIMLSGWSPPGAGCDAAPAGDLNCDCVVDGADLGILLGAWGSCA